MNLVLTPDQQKAKDAFITFLSNPHDTVFVLEGYSGTGKSTLVRHLMDELPAIQRAVKLIDPQAKMFYNIELTATTNKAAENLAQITGMDVKTIHSALGLRVNTDYKTGETNLVPKKGSGMWDTLLFIDEASYIDSKLLHLIFELVHGCKVVFMGDPAQLAPVKYSKTPVFEAGFTTARLSQVMRQAEGNPIIDLSTKFRTTVETGDFFQFKPDGQAVVYMDREAFEKQILAEFNRTDWKYHDSKVLGWTNKCVIGYNHAIRDHIAGDPILQAGDYAICNKFVSRSKASIKTDETVFIQAIDQDTTEHCVLGNWVTINGTKYFMPKSLKDKNDAIKAYRSEMMLNVVAEIEDQWIDLRAAFAQTINKSQGSTYERVFIDLDDVKRCNSGDQLARMMYVGVSRARQQVFLTGDLV